MNTRGRTLGRYGYAQIIRDMQQQPVGIAEVVSRYSVTDQCARRVLTRLHELRVCYVAEWVRLAKVGAAVPRYRYGDQPDAPRPGGKPGKYERIPSRPHNRLAELSHLVLMLRMLQTPMTAPQLSAECGTSHSNCIALLKHCKSIGLLRIAAWARMPTGPVAMWGHGSEPDAPRPLPKPRDQVNREYMRRKRGMVFATRLAAGFAWVQA